MKRAWPFRANNARRGGWSCAAAREDAAPQDETAAARLFVDLAARRFADENTRTKDLDSKAAPLLGFASGVTVLAAGALTKAPGCLSGWWTIGYHVMLVVGLLALIVAQWSLLWSLRARGYVQFNLREWPPPCPTRSSGEVLDLLRHMAKCYVDYTDHNKQENDRRVKWFTFGVAALSFGVTVTAAVLVLSSCVLPRLG